MSTLPPTTPAPVATAPAVASAASKPLWRVFVAFLGPMVLGNVLQSMSGTLTSVFIGQMLGTQALAAMVAVFPILFLLVSLVIGIGAGASVLIAQAWGAKDMHKVKAIAGTTLFLGALIGLAIALVGEVFADQLLLLLRTPADVLPHAIGYARVMMLAMPGLVVFILVSQMLRGVGDTTTPLFALLLSTTVSCVLTPAFIRGWAGLPQLGVSSAAAASVVSSVIALLYVGVHLRRRTHPLAPDRELWRALRMDRQLLAPVLRIGMPTGVQMIAVSLSEIALLPLVNRFGSDATAAFGAVNEVVNYVQFPALSIAIASSIIGARAIGAGRAGRLGAITRTGLMMNLLVTGSLVIVAYAFSRHLMALFITSEPVLVLAQSLLHIMLWSSVIFGCAAVLGGVMRASGTVLVPTCISVFCILAVEVPSAYGLAAAFGIEGVWMAYPIAFTAALILQAAFYLLVWRKKKIERLA